VTGSAEKHKKASVFEIETKFVLFKKSSYFIFSCILVTLKFRPSRQVCQPSHVSLCLKNWANAAFCLFDVFVAFRLRRPLAIMPLPERQIDNTFWFNSHIQGGDFCTFFTIKFFPGGRFLYLFYHNFFSG
jgi:hypothetical protein